MRFINKKTGIVAAVLAVLLAIGGVAYAYWTTTGAGSGSSTTAASNGTIVLHASFPANQLYPGGNVPVSFTADNTNATNLYVTSVTVTGITTSDVNCLATDFSVAPNPITENQMIAANSSGVALTNGTTLSFANDALNQDACKSATITLALSSN